MKSSKLSTVALIVPAYNEELVIERTLKSLAKAQESKHIYVIDDFSSDNTSKIARKYTRKVLRLPKNMGKATALNKVVSHYKLTQKYDYIMPIDADSHIDPDFLPKALDAFKKDPKVNAVVGKVMGRPQNWITAYRSWEYEIGQEVHKRAQSYANMVSVCPGPSTIFRSKVFKKIKYSKDTKTEDMDITFALHRKKLGVIKYVPKAKVYTQDPKTLGQYTKQIDRWYTGFWQCVLKHNIPWEGQSLDLDVGLLAIEGLFNGVLMIALVLFMPTVLAFGTEVLVIPFLIDLLVFVIPTLILTSIRYRTPIFFLYVPAFYLMRVITSFIFLRSFFRVVFLQDRKLGWNKVNRYAYTNDGK